MRRSSGKIEAIGVKSLAPRREISAGRFRALGTSVESASLLLMRWALLSLGLLGAILYVTGAVTPYPEKPSGSSKSAALVWPDDAQLDTRPGLPTHAIDPSAPSPQEATASIARQAQPASETQEPLLNDPAAPSAASSSDYPEQHSWGQLLRGAPLHSGPSVSSAVLGHAAAGTEMQLLERKLGWAESVTLTPPGKDGFTKSTSPLKPDQARWNMATVATRPL